MTKIPTAKEKYKETMAKIDRDNEANRQTDPDEVDLDEKAEEIMEQTETKTKTIEVTKEQYLLKKAQENNMKTLQNLRRLQNPHKTKLTQQQQAVMQKVLENVEKEKITDPVLLHLVNKKVKTSKVYLESQAKSRELYQEIMIKIKSISDEVIKCKGIIEDTDQEILEIVEKNPELLTGDVLK